MLKQTSRNADHVQRHNTPSPNNEEIANQLEALLTLAITAQQAYYRCSRFTRSHTQFAVNGGSSIDLAVA